jgi:hypothetical protein
MTEFKCYMSMDMSRQTGCSLSIYVLTSARLLFDSIVSVCALASLGTSFTSSILCCNALITCIF